jgi:hypothetical protein
MVLHWHWGFQYYMEREGFKPIKEGMPIPEEGYSYIVVPRNVSNTLVINEKVMKKELISLGTRMVQTILYSCWAPFNTRKNV